MLFLMYKLHDTLLWTEKGLDDNVAGDDDNNDVSLFKCYKLYFLFHTSVQPGCESRATRF